MRLIARDPFARYNTIRRNHFLRDSVKNGEACDWCGMFRVTKSGRKYVYQYGFVYDDRTDVMWQAKKFCSISCMRSFY